MTKEERKKQAKELLDQVRAFRFEITERDGMGMPDRLFDEELLTYRQALRDVPEISPDMDLDDKGQLINVNWPEIPMRYYVEPPLTE